MASLFAIYLGTAGPAALAAEQPAAHQYPGKAHQLLVIMDGLRPDYVTESRMPNVWSWSRNGLVFTAHHAAYPSVTRVNASTISTGAHPERHGLLGNRVYFPEVDEKQALSTADWMNLRRIEEKTGGRLLEAETLGQALERDGKKLVVCSSGSTGSAFLLNHKVSGGATLNTEFTLPASLDSVVQDLLGAAPPETYPNTSRNHRAVDAYLKVALDRLDADVAILWLCDPDHTAHSYGAGAAETDQALREVDNEFRRVLDGLKARGRFDQTNILLASDHGFSQNVGAENPFGILFKFMAQHGLSSSDLVFTDFALHLRTRREELLPALVHELQQASWTGAIFTAPKAPGSYEGNVPGTLSLDLVRMSHAGRAPDVVLSPRWDAGKNAFGFAGTVDLPGVAGHGSTSPYDMHATLLAAGPAFKNGIESSAPTHNADLCPTLCHLAGADAPATAQGRVLREALRDGPNPDSVPVTPYSYGSETVLPGGATFRTEAHISEVEGRRCFDWATGGRVE